ncbi:MULTISPECIES: N-acetylmuramic acid 6-phosphate etherase [unclassified Sutcliffiella]|uniref:N-acetylmuramic acid 6-phosphate etherase n=1 Tax=unclassified Sutcliffiella TaxID=2837532 RepID=UPI0030D06948
MKDTLSTLMTESRNERTRNIDNLSTREILLLMNEEDHSVPVAISYILPQIEISIEIIFEALKKGGRLIYIGAGTSGRLGVLDAVECPPTFRTDPEVIKGIIAGGYDAIFQAVEGAEDDADRGAGDLKKEQITSNDVVVGIAASGRTPYVLGAINYANSCGANTVGLTCNHNSELSYLCDVSLDVPVGPEVIAGSTRLKAASAHKMILNMLTTVSMVKLGKVYENLMVDMNVSNEKLKGRAINIIKTLTNAAHEESVFILEETDYDVKKGLVMILGKVTRSQAERLLEKTDGKVRAAIELSKYE